MNDRRSLGRFVSWDFLRLFSFAARCCCFSPLLIGAFLVRSVDCRRPPLPITWVCFFKSNLKVALMTDFQPKKTTLVQLDEETLHLMYLFLSFIQAFTSRWLWDCLLSYFGDFFWKSPKAGSWVGWRGARAALWWTRWRPARDDVVSYNKEQYKHKGKSNSKKTLLQFHFFQVMHSYSFRYFQICMEYKRRQMPVSLYTLFNTNGEKKS